MIVRAAWIVCVVLLWGAVPVEAENWPCWRGPRQDGISRESGIPTRWSDTENIAWKVAIPGGGHSSPIVWDDRVFVTTCQELSADEQTPVARILLCLDRRDGSILWQRTVVSSPLEKKHHLNSFASSTPATDGRLVYATFLESDSPDPKKNHGQMVVACFDVEGKAVWQAKPGVFSSTHGFCSSPVIYNDLLIVNGDHDGESYLVALNRHDGSVAWKVERENKTRSYVTPIIRQFAGKTQMILSGSKSVFSYDPTTGQPIWHMRGPTEQFVASMVDNGDLVFLTAGFPEKHILAIRPDGSGDVTQSHIVWRTTENCSYVPSPIIVGDYFLVVSDNGIASCLRAADGERMWKERVKRRYSASLVAAGGLVYFLSDDGECSVIKPGPEFELVSENALGEATYASPAISQGQLFLRGEKHLFCIGKP